MAMTSRGSPGQVTGSNFSNVLAIKQYIITSRRLRRQGGNKRRTWRRTGEEMNFWCGRTVGRLAGRVTGGRRRDERMDRQTDGRTDGRTEGRRGTARRGKPRIVILSRSAREWLTGESVFSFLRASSTLPSRVPSVLLSVSLLLPSFPLPPSFSPRFLLLEQPAFKASYSIRIRKIQDVDLRLPQVMIQIFQIGRVVGSELGKISFLFREFEQRRDYNPRRMKYRCLKYPCKYIKLITIVEMEGNLINRAL